MIVNQKGFGSIKVLIIRKNPSKCNEIKGESFFYGPRHEKITISETEAKKKCRENIEKGIVPVLFGG